MTQRGVSQELVKQTIANPRVVLQQSNSTYLYLSNQAAAVVNTQGRLVPTCGKNYFDDAVHGVLRTADKLGL